jgi:hypothetical protein
MYQTTTQATTRSRPIVVTILSVLAGIALVLAGVHLLQAVAILPYFIGPIAFRDFSLWYALLWGLMVWVWAWVARALWNVEPSAWLFLMIVSGFNLMFDFITMAFSPTTVTDLTVSFLTNLVIFGYTLLPGTKRAFGVE